MDFSKAVEGNTSIYSRGPTTGVRSTRFRGLRFEPAWCDPFSLGDGKLGEELDHLPSVAIRLRVRLAQLLHLRVVFRRGDGEAFGRLTRIMSPLLPPDAALLQLEADVARLGGHA